MNHVLMPPRYEDGGSRKQRSAPISKTPPSTSPDAPPSSTPKVDQDLRTLLDIDLLYAAVGLDGEDDELPSVVATRLPQAELRDTKPFLLRGVDIAHLRALVARMERSEGPTSINVDTDAPMELPRAASELLRALIRSALSDKAAVVMPIKETVGIAQAAALLGTSEDEVRSLIAEDKLPTSGEPDSLDLKGVLAHRQRARRVRREALDEFIALSAELEGDLAG